MIREPTPIPNEKRNTFWKNLSLFGLRLYFGKAVYIIV